MPTKLEQEVKECVKRKMESDSLLEKAFIPKKQREKVHKTSCVSENLSDKK